MAVSLSDLLWLFVAGAAVGIAGVSAADHFIGLTGWEWALGLGAFVYANYRLRNPRGDRDPEEAPA